jgi:hypothetical protein
LGNDLIDFLILWPQIFFFGDRRNSCHLSSALSG